MHGHNPEAILISFGSSTGVALINSDGRKIKAQTTTRVTFIGADCIVPGLLQIYRNNQRFWLVEMLRKMIQALIMVIYMCSSFWLLRVESRDFSQAEKERTACKVEQIHKMTTNVTHKDNLGPF